MLSLIFICVYSDDFMGSGYSSFTNLIGNLRGERFKKSIESDLHAT